MIAVLLIFGAFVLGGCIGLVLTALLRTAADPTSDALIPAEFRRARS